MATFYVDEAGFTGEDLLADDQPVFVEATSDYSLQEAETLIGDIFRGLKREELKHGRLVRNLKNRERIVELVRVVASQPERAATWIAHKEFGLVTLIVEWWMEPLAYRGGLNLYKDGANHAMANMLFVSLEGFWSKSFRRKLFVALSANVSSADQGAV